MSKNQMPPNKMISIHKVFEHLARQSPNGLAIRFSGQDITYKDLNERANYLAKYLQGIGVQHSDIVAIAFSHSAELIISMLAILKCGAAYLPIDDASPASRNKAILETAKVKVIISKDASCNDYSNGLKSLIANESSLFNSNLEEFNSYSSAEDDGAYVMFTSGSTGAPKGVLVPHRAVIRLVRETNYIQIKMSDRILQFAPPSFDASTFEVWGALLNSATLVPYSGTVVDPNVLKSDIRNNEVTILWLTAALFHLVTDKFIEALEPLRVLLAGGDVLNPKYVNKVLDTFPNITVINGYGPTENTTFTCCHLMTLENKPSGNVPIGKAISGTTLHILDDAFNIVESGQVGELYVSGPGVALGYLNEENQGDAFFINKDISPDLIYRTGDLVKENANGELAFIGRKDNQVKIRGYRVSLEEIKTHIVELENVSDALVITKKFSSGDQLLVAHIQTTEGLEPDIKKMKASLELVIPKYMIPDQFVFNSQLPINDNGKIDTRKFLSTIEG
ncbi:amino acid adenylation domain-containing protein [Aliikangiella coralliicola]|uniref:Amino acid adenylation domain-containing protein n=1 Tax=Aliikangiella coralliicola TaxID=2592383 RepID=A0A545TV48_9GAMM|nr:amino acid adenylation domain-containing protein [Aliikangiella coralliicola]TQV81084.1 amino acid adenylation domain-containing protein [Aliikangiella coralliicola]